jgi:hypothetical protein
MWLFFCFSRCVDCHSADAAAIAILKLAQLQLEFTHVLQGV